MRGPKPKDHAKLTTDFDRQEYLPYLSKALESMISDGAGLPIIKKATSPTHNFQVTGHLQVADALQGYWERNKNIYTHRARSDYRALYLGTILMLEEERLRMDKEEDVGNAKLQEWVEICKVKHQKLRTLTLLRNEIKIMLAENDDGVLSDEEFHQCVLKLLETFTDKADRIQASLHIDRMIEDEGRKMKNRKYQAKHREYEKIAKGIREVEEG